MFERFLRRWGYVKLSREEDDLLLVVKLAAVENKDIFIDSLKRKGTQKVYVKEGKKSKCVLEVKLIK